MSNSCTAEHCSLLNMGVEKTNKKGTFSRLQMLDQDQYFLRRPALFPWRQQCGVVLTLSSLAHLLQVSCLEPCFDQNVCRNLRML